jgi:hypothetical protein
VILLDSCAYFRLARSIRPLLAGTFGPAPPYSLFVLAELDGEYVRSQRLRSKFEWVIASEYREDREKKRYECKGKLAKDVDTAFSYLAAYARQQGLLLAHVDLRALAVGYARKITVVSDDRGIRRVAETHAIGSMGTLDLLKLMVDDGRILPAKVAEVMEYLHHENDLPMGLPELRECYSHVFGVACPV